jgi:hypothetical protein
MDWIAINDDFYHSIAAFQRQWCDVVAFVHPGTSATAAAKSTQTTAAGPTGRRNMALHQLRNV